MILILCLTFMAFSSSLLAQETVRSKPTIFEALLADGAGDGFIAIHQSQHIMQLVGRPSSALSNARYSNGYAILQGYRVQLYSGNQANSKSIAQARAAQVKEYFPELETTVEYDAPFWRLRVGGFIELPEARASMNDMKRQFPAFAKEMYVVRSTVRIKQ